MKKTVHALRIFILHEDEDSDDDSWDMTIQAPSSLTPFELSQAAKEALNKIENVFAGFVSH